MNEYIGSDLSLSEIGLKRAKIREDFVRTYLAVNISGIDLTPEIFNSLQLVEKYGEHGICFWVEPKEKND